MSKDIYYIFVADDLDKIHLCATRNEFNMLVSEPLILRYTEDFAVSVLCSIMEHYSRQGDVTLVTNANFVNWIGQELVTWIHFEYRILTVDILQDLCNIYELNIAGYSNNKAVAMKEFVTAFTHFFESFVLSSKTTMKAMESDD